MHTPFPTSYVIINVSLGTLCAIDKHMEQDKKSELLKVLLMLTFIVVFVAVLLPFFPFLVILFLVGLVFGGDGE